MIVDATQEHNSDVLIKEAETTETTRFIEKPVKDGRALAPGGPTPPLLPGRRRVRQTDMTDRQARTTGERECLGCESESVPRQDRGKRQVGGIPGSTSGSKVQSWLLKHASAP